MDGKPGLNEGPKRHEVKVTVVGKKITYNKPCIIAARGEIIEWTIDPALPFAVVVKAHHSPLARAAYVAPKKGNPLEVKVKKDAVPGLYPYALCVCVGDTLVVEDPDIIIKPPNGRE